jgi:3-phenylpropionate/trans-cinnamate dioxygenase ferredoxin reductase component
MQRGVVIVGGGHAGGRVAERLRARGFKDTIDVIGSESELPYERPPLSKACLLGPDRVTNAYLLPEQRWRELEVTFHLGREAVAIDRAARRVHLDNGRHLAYRHLVLATGLSPRRLDVLGPVASGVSYLRDFADAGGLRNRLRPGLRLLIIGAGLIGLEVAASAVSRGSHVTIIEAAPRPLTRLFPQALSHWLSQVHQKAGVRILCGRMVVDAVAWEEGVRVTLDDGRTIVADEILVAIGGQPNDGLAQRAGLTVDDGIVVNEFGQTSDPDIFAIGDVARHHNEIFARSWRLESWRNAEDMATVVAANLCGLRQAYREVPWFWTDQYDWNIQIAGVPAAGADILTRGEMGQRGHLAYYCDGRHLRGAVGIGCGRDIRIAREIMRSGAAIDRSDLAKRGFVSQAEPVGA